MPVRVYYEDTDAGGIVYHATYLRWMERVRTEWLRACGVSHAALAESDLQCVVSALSIRYLAPARLDELLEVELELGTLRRASLVLTQRVRRSEDTLLLADASVRVAVLHRSTGRPAALPDALIERLRES